MRGGLGRDTEISRAGGGRVLKIPDAGSARRDGTTASILRCKRGDGEESLRRTSEVSWSGQMCSQLLQLLGRAETSCCKKGLPLRRGRRQEIPP